MSLTPSYKGETASASPESPREGDFSSRQFYDNFRSLEEHETCDNKRGPIVNKVPDNYSGFPLKAQICALLLTNDLENVCAAPFGGCCSESNILLEPPEAESENSAHLATCEYCQKLHQPLSLGEPLKNGTPFERVFCCEQAKRENKRWSKIFQKETKKLEMKYYGRMPNHTSEKEPQKGGWMRPFQRWREQMKHQNSEYDSVSKEMRQKLVIQNTCCEFSLGKLTPQQDTIIKPKIEVVKYQFYKGGACFRMMFSDGTGTVFYPSGKPAVIISSAEPPHFTYIILEDKDKAPSIKGVFTTNGYSTCYHSSGLIWLNISPGGGLYFSKTGDLRRCWNWFYFDPHMRNLPFKPLVFALGPYISVHVHSHDCVYINFMQKQNHIRFNVGSKLKLFCPDSHYQSGKDVLEIYFQLKKTEIYSLLDQMQTCISHPSANVCDIVPRRRLIARKEQLSKQVEKGKSPIKKNAHPI
ncbi:glutamate-rich protein 6 [Cyprinodon tularosa]|uniref:glutamate-rich protein 6 n=1 Tax=Cyprinodon tularosa TaxID=77115 RepID=UPI0018E1F99D|nr:glutamate-rich protein 6 [Cyprinodon tularosa]